MEGASDRYRSWKDRSFTWWDWTGRVTSPRRTDLTDSAGDYVANLQTCLVGMEACCAIHHLAGAGPTPFREVQQE